MAAPDVRRAFMLFHIVLGVGLLIMSVETLAHAVRERHADHVHLAFVSGFEALGAVLLLIPRTVRWGGGILLVVLLSGFVIHLTRAEWEIQLLIYAAGVWFVMVHGFPWAPTSAPPDLSDITTR